MFSNFLKDAFLKQKRKHDASTSSSSKKVRSSSGSHGSDKKRAADKKKKGKDKKTGKNGKSIKKSGGVGKAKWSTLQHCGVLFPPPYVPHGVKMLYNGRPVHLTPEQEEVRKLENTQKPCSELYWTLKKKAACRQVQMSCL